MIVSNYTFCFNIEGGYYIYNTLSNAFIEIDKESYDIINTSKKNKTKLEEDRLSRDFFSVLVDKHFVTDSMTDEFLIYKSWINGMRNTQNQLNLTISPTMDCNFRCHYCFENHEKTYISESMIDNIIKFINSIKGIDNVSLTWFGGEPLLAIDQIKSFYDKFRPTCKANYNSNMISTCYLLTPKIIEILKQIEISSIQITLDGTKEFHNSIKKDNNCKDVFSKTIEKIDMLAELAPEIGISIRTNLTKHNAGSYIELYSFIMDRYRGKKVGISPAFVMNRNKHKDNDVFFSKKEQVDFLLNLAYKYRIPTQWLEYPSKFIYECAVRNIHCYGFDPDGYIYKCWENIGKKSYAFAKLTDNGYEHLSNKQLNRFLFGADPLDNSVCKKCSYLPLCNGGCPFHRIENEFEGGNSNCCTTYKGRLLDFFKIYIKLKKMGFYDRSKNKDNVEGI